MFDLEHLIGREIRAAPLDANSLAGCVQKLRVRCDLCSINNENRNT